MTASDAMPHTPGSRLSRGGSNGTEQSVILVDGPAVLRAKSRHGILDNHLFHDNVHPNLKGHVALAEAVLAGLKDRAAFGWPASTPAPVLEPAASPRNSTSMRPPGRPFADGLAAHYGQLAFLTVDSRRTDSSGAIATVQAAQQIEAGGAPENTGIPGSGTRE